MVLVVGGCLDCVDNHCGPRHLEETMTQQTNPSRPSEGAWRAAEKLINSGLVQSQGISSTLRLARKVDTATIVDRETGMAELLEAAKKITNSQHMPWSEEFYLCEWCYAKQLRGEEHKPDCAWVQLKQAITKAEGSGH